MERSLGRQQRQRVSQTHLLAPQMQHYFQLLDMSLPDLHAFLNRLVMENCLLQEEFTLEVAFPASDAGAEGSDPSAWLGANRPFESLEMVLKEQLCALALSKEKYRIAEAVIGELDPKGYFRTDLVEFAAWLEVSESEVWEALNLIQTFFPCGVGARNLAECLLLQLPKGYQYNKEVKRMLTEDVGLLERHRLKELAAKYGLSLQCLNEILKFLQRLNPFPGSAYEEWRPQYIYPDLVIDRELHCTVNGNGGELLRLDETLFKRLQGEGDEEAQRYLKEKWQQGKDLIRLLQMRSRTLARLGRFLCREQAEFFQYGSQYLKPCTVQEAADALQLHATTLNRCISQKYVQTHWGMLPLRRFFTARLSADGDEASVSAAAVQAMIAEWIRQEPPDAPYSDQQLTQRLENRGIHISRRTVAKYRSLLHIDSAQYRRIP